MKPSVPGETPGFESIHHELVDEVVHAMAIVNGE
jgi:hypothetical protein